MGIRIALAGNPNSGKTTLFNIISGLVTPDEGKVLLDGEDITGKPGKISYMLQKDLLLPYRTIADKQHRAIAGLSMGGFHTMHTAALLNQTFDYVGIFSALYVPYMSQHRAERTLAISDLALSDKPAYNQTETLREQEFANPPQLYWIACGVDDFLYQDNVVYRQYLDEKQYPYEYHESTGGHSWKNWMDYLTIFAQRIF